MRLPRQPTTSQPSSVPSARPEIRGVSWFYARHAGANARLPSSGNAGTGQRDSERLAVPSSVRWPDSKPAVTRHTWWTETSSKSLSVGVCEPGPKPLLSWVKHVEERGGKRKCQTEIRPSGITRGLRKRGRGENEMPPRNAMGHPWKERESWIDPRRFRCSLQIPGTIRN